MGDFTTLMEKEEAWLVVAWYATIRMFQVRGIMEPIWLKHIPSMPGYVWIAKGSEHKTLARLYINWFISHLGQIPPYEEYGIPKDLFIRGMCYGVIPEDREKYLPE
jgi:spermidine/putrescine-binding protein